MVTVAFYAKNKENNNIYDKHIETETFQSENQARLRALAFNWAYSVIFEW